MLEPIMKVSVEAVLVHLPSEKRPSFSAVRPEVRAVAYRDIPDLVL